MTRASSQISKPRTFPLTTSKGMLLHSTLNFRETLLPTALHLQSLRDHAHFSGQQTEAEPGSPSRPHIAKLEPFLYKTSTAGRRRARVELEPHL